MKVIAAPYLVALNVNLQNGAGRSDAARYTLALVWHIWYPMVLRVVRHSIVTSQRSENLLYRPACEENKNWGSDK